MEGADDGDPRTILPLGLSGREALPTLKPRKKAKELFQVHKDSSLIALSSPGFLIKKKKNQRKFSSPGLNGDGAARGRQLGFTFFPEYSPKCN